MVNEYKPSNDSSSSASSVSNLSYQDEHEFQPVPLGESSQDQYETPKAKSKDKDSESIISTSRRSLSSLRRRTSSVSRTTSRKSYRSLHDDEELDKVLTRQFDIADAIRLEENTQPLNNNELKSFKDKDDRSIQDDLELGRPSSKVEKIFTNKSTGEIDLPPDGGYGWVCVACVVSIQACTWGSNAGFGIFLQYYLDNDVFPGATSMDYALIAGIIVFAAQFCAPFAMIVMRLVGFKLTMSIACCTHLIGYILGSFATKIWHLYVCQGIIVGASYSFLFTPANIVVPGWFLKKRGLASGFCFGGTGLGGVIFSVGVNATIKKTGDQVWALRMVGIVTCAMTLTSIIFIKPRTPIKRDPISWANLTKHTKLMFNPRVLKGNSLWYISLWFALSIIGYNMVIFSYSTYATTMGLSPNQASTLTALINAAQTLGRPIMGYIADRYVGRVTFPLVLDVLLAIFILAFWINAKTFISLLFCGLLIGFTIGVGNVMSAVLIADSFALEDFVSGWAIMNMILGFFSLPTEVMALALRDHSLSNPFLYTQIFGGLLFIVAIFILLPQREWQVRLTYKKRREQFVSDLRSIDFGEESGNVHVEEMKKDLRQRIRDCDEVLKQDAKHYFKRLAFPMKI